MSKLLSLLLVSATAACGPQKIDAVSCSSSLCAGTGGGVSSGGTAGAGGDRSSGGGGSGSGGRAELDAGTVDDSGLIHRYSFDISANGVEVIDSVRGMNGVLVGAAYGEGEAAGTVLLAGKDSNQYVDLPNHLLDGLTQVTIEAWVTWAGGDAWQRVFDFGEDETGADGSRNGQPRSYVFLALIPKARFAFRPPPIQSKEILMTGPDAFPTGELTHVAVVIDPSAQLSSLFVGGLEVTSTRFQGVLSDVYDVNNWLGRSQYLADAGFEGSFSEFRIYDRALSAAELSASAQAGPDAKIGR